MKRSRRTDSRDYKLAAVKKVIEQGLSYAEVARDLGIGDTLIHNWRKAFEADGTLQAEVTQSPSVCLLYTSPSPRDRTRSRMPSSA